MLLRTLNDEFFELSHFHKFFVAPSDGCDGYLIIGLMPPSDDKSLPHSEIIGGGDTMNEAMEILNQIMKRMAMGESCYSVHKIVEEMSRPSLPIEDIF
jgi:hypothetical protein